MKNKIIILIAILSLVLTSVPFTVVVDAAKPFENLSETEMIEKMLEKEVVANKDDGLFHAEEEISKEDFINMTARLFNITDENKSEKLLQNNVISQKFIDDESSVVPNEKAAIILCRAFINAYQIDIDGNCDMRDFSDVSGCAQPYVKKMWNWGFIKNDSGFFNPQANLTRGDAAVIAYKMFYTDHYYTCKNGPGTYKNDEMAKEVKEAYNRGARKVVIQPGTYYLYNPSEANTTLVSHFEISGVSDFTLEGYNVKFIGCTPALGDEKNRGLCVALFAKSDNITVRGFTTDYIYPIFTQGKVVKTEVDSNNGNWVEIEIDEGYPNQLEDRNFFGEGLSVYLYDKDTHKFKKGCGVMNLNAFTKVNGYERRWRARNWAPYNQQAYEVGDLISTRMNNFTAMNTRFVSCLNATLEDYTVCAGTFGVLFEPSKRVEGKSDVAHLKNVKITYGEKPEGATQDRLLSTAADGIHMSYLSGEIILEDCLVEGNSDDSYALNGRHFIVTQTSRDTVDSEGKPLDDTDQLKKNQFILGTQYYSSVVRAGDVMACYDRESNYLGAIKLTSVKRIGRGDLPYTSPKDANMIGFCAMEEWLLVEAEDDSIVRRLDYMMDTDASAGKYVMRNCIGRDTIMRGVLSQNWNGVIENCEFSNVGSQGVSLMGETNCAQGPYARDIVIKDCKFENCGYGGVSGGMFNPSPALNTGIAESGLSNGNIVVDGCYFTDNYGHDIKIGNTKNAILTNNVFGKRNDYTKNANYPGKSSVKIKNSEDVLFDKSNIALTEREFVSYQDVKNFKTEAKSIYSSEFTLKSENKPDNEWSYEYAAKGTDNYELYNYGYYADGAWVATVPLWSQNKKQNSEYGYILGTTEVYPGSGYDLIETYTAPYDGKIQINFNNGLSIKRGVKNENGVKFKVIKNTDTQIWPQAGWKSITSSTPISYVEPIVTDVKKGDKIRFRVNCNNDRWNDNFMLSPEVEYISGYKETTPVYDFAVNERYISKNVGETVQLSTIGAEGKVEWRSSREKVAEVDQNGRVTLKYPGMVSVTANDGKREATCIIAVHQNNDSGIAFSTKMIKASKGETLELPLEIADGINKSDIKIKSGDNKKVKVNPDGTVTAVSSDIAEVPVVAEYKNHKTEIIICII